MAPSALESAFRRSACCGRERAERLGNLQRVRASIEVACMTRRSAARNRTLRHRGIEMFATIRLPAAESGAASAPVAETMKPAHEMARSIEMRQCRHSAARGPGAGPREGHADHRSGQRSRRGREGRGVSRSHHGHGCADRHLFVELDHMLVQHPDATVRHGLAD